MQPELKLADPSDVRFSFPCFKAKQPIGDLYIGVLPFKVLCTIADFDVRRVLQEDRDVDRYLGIQRQLSPKRTKEIGQYVNFSDATFPTSIILSVDERCASFDEDSSTMTLHNVRDEKDPILTRNIARVIDGQHRIAGLYNYRGSDFDCPVTFLLGVDLADQGQVFARVNLSQTKVNPSLAYDLYELTQARSPQKTCHDITVRLDRERDGPFYRKIKRLGIATEGRTSELLTQSTVVNGIMQHISARPDLDRDVYLKGAVPSLPTPHEAERFVFRQWFIEDKDDLIYAEIDKYFRAVRDKWPDAWNEPGRGVILPRTNGYLALMRLLPDIILYWSKPGQPLSFERYKNALDLVDIDQDDLTTANYDPGTSGEAKLYREMREYLVR